MPRRISDEPKSNTALIVSLSVGIPLVVCIVAVVVIMSIKQAPVVVVPDEQPKQIVSPKPRTPQAKVQDWANAATDEVTEGDMTVRVTSVEIGKVPLSTFSGNSQSEKDHLMVKLLLTNKSGTRKLIHSGWAGDEFSFQTAGKMKDNFGNVHRRQTFGFSTNVIGQAKSTSIFPGKTCTDVLVFDVPVDKMESLKLELPALAYGDPGTIRFEIPKGMIQQAK